MKKISVYLHQDVIDILRCFGELNDVINNLIKDSLLIDELYEETLRSPKRSPSCKRVEFTINEDLYDELAGIRVRPLIYWFVENEMYDQLGGKMVKQYGEHKSEKINKQFDKVLYEFDKLNKLCNNRFRDEIDNLRKVRSEYGAQ